MGNGLLTIWKINVQGKDGQTNIKIVKIGIGEDGSRAPWLESIKENLLNISVPITKNVADWKLFASNKKQKLLEILH